MEETQIHTQREDSHVESQTQGIRPCEDGGRDWSDTSTSQGLLAKDGRQERGMEQVLPHSPWKEPTLLTLDLGQVPSTL